MSYDPDDYLNREHTMSNGFRTAIKNVRLKADPSGKIHLLRIRKLPAGKNRRTEEAKAKRQEAAWKAKR